MARRKWHSKTKGKPVRVIFRDARGKFLPQADRYTPKVAMVQAVRNKYYTILAERGLPAKDLIEVLSQREFESLKEATKLVKDYSSKSKYKAWDIAEQIDKTKGIRRQDIKLTVSINDGGKLKQFSFYHQIKRNTSGSYNLFRRINQEIGLEGMFLYDQANGKMLADRTGKKVKLVGIKVEKIV
jgi:hypothetical protein